MKTIARAVAVALMTAGAVAVPLTAEASATPLPGSVSAAPVTSALHRGDSARIHHPSHYRDNGDLRRYHGVDLPDQAGTRTGAPIKRARAPGEHAQTSPLDVYSYLS
ncbi:hypothetical protein ACWDWT_43175, partial [Streptomyces sp. NPDC003343]